MLRQSIILAVGRLDHVRCSLLVHRILGQIFVCVLIPTLLINLPLD